VFGSWHERLYGSLGRAAGSPPPRRRNVYVQSVWLSLIEGTKRGDSESPLLLTLRVSEPPPEPGAPQTRSPHCRLLRPLCLHT
jgi:hypothetical protein